jgi:NADPH:quinone reductase-like Zn-dependent oxidoreductase
MKAIVLKEYGGVDQLELRDQPAPEPKANEIQVRVAGASLNPVDWKLRSGALKAWMPLSLPAILGRDASGVVTKVGPGVTAFAPGDRVMGLVNGGYAELVVAPLDAWAKLPGALDVIDAGALPLVVLTGTQLIEEAVKPKAGQTVLVTGALGGVGRAAIHAAKKRGAKVWAGVRAAQRDEARSLGADGVVGMDDADDVAKLPELDAIADTIGGPTLVKLLPKVRAGGTIGSVVGDSPEAKARGLSVHALMAHADGKRLGELGEAVARGELAIPIGRRFPLAEAREAQSLAEKGGVGKVLLTP